MKLILTQLLLLSLLMLTLTAPATHADEKLAGLACRSVHLGYTAPAGNAFYNEVIVDQSAPGTYFCVCGFNHGYFGIQQLDEKRKVAIFSVWDPGNQNDPKSVEEKERVKLLYSDPAVRVKRFGGEGTGGQSFLDLDWQNGQTYRLLITSERKDERTAYTGWIYQDKESRWLKLVTFSTITKDEALGGYYSFVEDFRRNKISATHARVARFGNAWVRDIENKWQPVNRARFTADGNPAMSINAGLKDRLFFLATGGETTNTDIPLNKPIDLPIADRQVPADLAKLLALPASK
ncbi:hypothetical protein ETAA8_63450 [Anatilimnocola aggregata]|uniref:Uncharacterized protein n=1 Tax=Anatilimnocola aggregata TaxID=2528021 RepID=A0A517YLT5_9BACT|nr:DUF3472 domain-containing protein [Anatilimnocola aggregata]QDU31192.1 hypothetical protein ETAA8_63450 [Anatilimnocola aggregata]